MLVDWYKYVDKTNPNKHCYHTHFLTQVKKIDDDVEDEYGNLVNIGSHLEYFLYLDIDDWYDCDTFFSFVKAKNYTDLLTQIDFIEDEFYEILGDYKKVLPQDIFVSDDDWSGGFYEYSPYNSADWDTRHLKELENRIE